jgi:diazepam-binding inhibitor (GABA receptor modulator, acyl-CoA-binding protein)
LSARRAAAATGEGRWLSYDALSSLRHAQRCPRTKKVHNGGDTVSDLKAKFEKAVADSKNLPERPDNQTLLKLYALFKQASSGDVDGKRPGFTDMVGRAKWDAWNEIKGLSTDDAMKQYVALIEDLKG